MLRFLVVVCCSLAFFRPAISTAIGTEALEPVAARGFEPLELLPSALLDRRCGWSVGRNTGKFSWVPRPALRTVSGHALRIVSGHAMRTVSGHALRTVYGHALRTVSGQLTHCNSDRSRTTGAGDRATVLPHISTTDAVVICGLMFCVLLLQTTSLTLPC